MYFTQFRQRLMLLGFGLILLSGCWGQATPEKGSGVAASEERALEPFTAIEVNGIGKINVQFGSKDSCTVRTDDNILELYETRVEDGTLYLAVKSLVTPKAGINVTIKTSNVVERLKMTGACEVNFGNYSGSLLTVEGDGANKFTAVGTVDRLVLNATGNVEFDLFELEANNAEINAVGSSLINVFAEGVLGIKGEGAVVVTYDGDPTVNKDLTGVSRAEER